MPHTLSFLNLAELHVLSFLRDQRVSLQPIRRAVSYRSRSLGQTAATRSSQWICVSQRGQLAMGTLLEAHLRRIERNARTKEVLRLYPFAWPVRSSEDGYRVGSAC